MTGKNEHLAQLGFRVGKGGGHLARTMMLKELRELLAYVDCATADRKHYLKAIAKDNCLGKRSDKTRSLTYKHLASLYSLDISDLLFRALLFFWNRDPAGQPLLALLCAYARDPILRSSAPFILNAPQGTRVMREDLEAFIEDQAPGRFSSATLLSTAQNINSTWTQAGYLSGRRQKVRVSVNPTPGSTSYALLLGYLSGAPGTDTLPHRIHQVA